ncbi:hypothetical protein MTP09_13780 [Chryseobacterium suipulveris]|uniref:Uncharacterized protein n=1 Tax=Chryseobacterium suipulveris TaxID=2929800 RepID=A0ABY4BP28_9FLAO|nr:hypothetical protein [Chryseobacterium suipulveris]UOE40955.1 hypothetical protein MTP09_13780 [Chryseobacterium suipulveris]
MNTQVIFKKAESFGIFLLTFFFSVLALAQESTTPDAKVDITTTKTTTTTEEWFTNPVYWVIGALLLIILIAVVARGGGNKE